MAGGYLYGWYNTIPKKWVKVQCTALGKLIADISGFLQNPPEEDDEECAPSSAWAFAHKENANAHHTPPVAGDFDHNDLDNINPGDHHDKYTDVNSRAAIGDLLSSTGYALINLNMFYRGITNAGFLRLRASATDGIYVQFTPVEDSGNLQFIAYEVGVGYVPASLSVYNGDDHEQLATEVITDAKIETHKDIVNAHHAKYTNLEAQTACNMNGGLYWSCAGIAFDAALPATQVISKHYNGYIEALADGIDLRCSVNLPTGCTVSGVIVYGNTAAEAESWFMKRITLSGGAQVTMATQSINTEDITIDNPVIDNSLYAYFIITSSIDTNDQIYGALVVYTL